MATVGVLGLVRPFPVPSIVTAGSEGLRLLGGNRCSISATTRVKSAAVLGLVIVYLCLL
jgi:hypothetical protein